jgi:hypothetical protein
MGTRSKISGRLSAETAKLGLLMLGVNQATRADISLKRE